MIQVFIYLFSGSLYIFDKPFNHPYQQPEKMEVIQAQPCTEPFLKRKTGTYAIGDTVWVNTAPKTGFWAVLKDVEL
jgi:hypothetical protein